MKAEIIAVGTELLLGQVTNTNATFLSEELASLGIDVYYHTVVGDNVTRLKEVLRQGQQRSDLLVLCGGLGPTDDDLTKEVVAELLGRELQPDAAGAARLTEFFQAAQRTMTPNNLRQVLTIAGGQPIANPVGLAIGSLVTVEATSYLLLPGPPNELKPMFQQEVRPLLKELFPQTTKLFSRVLRFYGIGESALVTELKSLLDAQTNPTIAPYAKPNEVTLRLTAKATDDQQAQQLLNQTEQQIQQQVGDYFYGYGDENSLVQETVRLLKAQQVTIAAAESLTAGLFQSTLGTVAGVSEVFLGGFVTYSATSKQQLLDIEAELIETEGMVSEACAKAMAENARCKVGADYAVSFTGVAGPDKLEGQAPGTVWIGFAKKGSEPQAYLCHFTRDREYVRHSAVMKGLDIVRRALLAEI